MSDETIDSATLRVLAAFALDTNLRRAALELGLPRSTLSRHLTELEERLGQPIFSRRGRSLTMTSFGERLVARAKAARDAILDLETTAREPSLGGRTMTLAISPLFAEFVLPGVLPTLCERYPTARIQVVLSHAYSDLFDDRVDVALRRGPLVDSTSMNARRLGRLGMVCVATPKTLAGCEGSLDERIKALRWLRVAASLEPFPLTVVGDESAQSEGTTNRHDNPQHRGRQSTPRARPDPPRYGGGAAQYLRGARSPERRYTRRGHSRGAFFGGRLRRLSSTRSPRSTRERLRHGGRRTLSRPRYLGPLVKLRVPSVPEGGMVESASSSPVECPRRSTTLSDTRTSGRGQSAARRGTGPPRGRPEVPLRKADHPGRRSFRKCRGSCRPRRGECRRSLHAARRGGRRRPERARVREACRGGRRLARLQARSPRRWGRTKSSPYTGAA